MADQGKWFKLWESALDDQQLENLDLENWARWARLGTYIKKHGKDGELVVLPPCRALQTLLRVGDFDAVISVINVLPGYVIEEIKSETVNVTIASVSFKIRSRNWSKYQGDYSTERTRRWRLRRTANVTRQEERRREVEEKRNPLPTALPSATSTSQANTNGLTPREKGTNPRALGTNPRSQGTNPRAIQEQEFAAAKEMVRKSQPPPGHYDTEDSEILGPEEFAKIKAGINGAEADEIPAWRPEDGF